MFHTLKILIHIAYLWPGMILQFYILLYSIYIPLLPKEFQKYVFVKKKKKSKLSMYLVFFLFFFYFLKFIF